MCVYDRVTCRSSADPLDIAEGGALDFAVGGLGDLVDELDLAGVLVFAQLRLHVLLEVGLEVVAGLLVGRDERLDAPRASISDRRCSCPSTVWVDGSDGRPVVTVDALLGDVQRLVWAVDEIPRWS